ncbi:IucA/IucC family protein [Noviherbaspirillum sedimenti]|uniref:Iron transporter n=1 Tax=Noviherbaspirillum sedimenti TaxID=2320865 RepID=A0A3A3G1Z0_9BURK|nr:IucA/IucC family protein [Noviherbaspirillum sedimenti]RJG01675.1 iron transporter [Noviherbaspirillum sedimenti]
MQANNLAYAIDPALLARQEARRRSMETLLNCYCREVAEPQGQLHVGPLFGQSDWPQSVQMALRNSGSNTGGSVMHIRLPLSGARLLTVVEQASVTGNYRYRSPFYCKAPAKPWDLLDWEGLAGMLLRELSLQTDTPRNDELMQQIRDSVNVTAAVLQSSRPGPFAADPLQAFIESEQSLVFGHPFHPAPKSRQGVSYDDMLRYSPEIGAKFPLHYFAVRREYLLQQSVLDTPCDQIIAEQAPDGLAVDDDYALIPTHPWQARYLLEHASVAQAIRTDRIRDLGPQGKAYYPTSSIRTLFHPENPYFYKGSLNIRITNCVRKNAVYELEGALQVTRIMRELMPVLQQQFPGVRVLEEPAFISVDLMQNDEQLDREVTEGFGMILRRSFNEVLHPGVTPLLAGALFGNHLHGEQRMRELLAQMGQRRSLPPEEAAEQWFSRYVAEVMYPVLHCYFAHGVIFEPHLQNVVIGVASGEPRQVFLRDFEGVKLVSERFSEQQLQHVTPRTRAALWYSNELGWNRIAYCLFVNNFCEAISQIGAGSPRLQHRLWSVVRHHLHNYQTQHGDAHSMLRIKALLDGEPFPGKSNLLNRFFKRADRATTYLPVANPLGMIAEDKAWN